MSGANKRALSPPKKVCCLDGAMRWQAGPGLCQGARRGRGAIAVGPGVQRNADAIIIMCGAKGRQRCKKVAAGRRARRLGGAWRRGAAVLLRSPG